MNIRDIGSGGKSKIGNEELPDAFAGAHSNTWPFVSFHFAMVVAVFHNLKDKNMEIIFLVKLLKLMTYQHFLGYLFSNVILPKQKSQWIDK